MRRTTFRDVLVSSIVGVSVGYLLQAVLVRSGLQMLVPPVTFSCTLLFAAILVLVLAWPIRLALHGKRTRPIQALFAARVAVLAKASSLSGTLLTGFTAGLGYFVLTRAVPPNAGVLVLLFFSLVAAGALWSAGLIAERWCTLPPNNPEVEQSDV